MMKRSLRLLGLAGHRPRFAARPNWRNDHAATLPVIAHAIRWWEENRAPVEFACCIYATAPFLRAEFLCEGFRILKEKPDAEFVFSVTSYAFPIFRAIQIGESVFRERSKKPRGKPRGI